MLLLNALGALALTVLAAYMVQVWVTTPGIDERLPVSAAEMAARQRGPGGTPAPLHIPIAWSDMPATIRDATVAIEDERFYEHGAVDAKGMARAAFKDVFSGRALEGGSTIAQQLARSLYIGRPDRNLARKIRETKLASQLERAHSKQWILWQYLNSVPYGAVNGRVLIGIESAAQAFFSKPARSLTLAESALLAGLPQGPTRYDPFRYPGAARQRRAEVLAKMSELGLASAADVRRAAREPVALTACGAAPTTAADPSRAPFAPSGAVTAAAAAAQDGDLSAFLRQAGRSSGAYVFDATTRRALFRWRESEPRTLASNTKLFTAAAVLARMRTLGGIETTLLGTGRLRGGVLYGDLYLRGGGNPAFGVDEHASDMQRLARQLRDRGVREVRGMVLGDGSLFDTRTGGPDSGGRTSIFIGPLTALTFDRGKAPDVDAAFEADPMLAAAQMMSTALEAQGIHVLGPSGTGRAPARARRFAAVSSRPIEKLVQHMVKWSDSFSAEILLKDLAVMVGHRPGSTAAGAREVNRYARSLGVDVRLRDGSGLCRKNEASPRDVVRLLDHLRGERSFPAYFQSLPVAGRDGTLYTRMRTSPARDRCSAKTATLSDVSNLSGYCRTQRGHIIVFSFMMDGVDVASARRLQDGMTASVACLRSDPEGSDVTPGVYHPPVFSGGLKKLIALTFDDGPSRYTPRIISTLRRFHAGATFFQVGYAQGARQPVGAVARRHDINVGSHTFEHADLAKLEPAAQRREILAGARAIARRGGPFPRLFRPPYDSYNLDTLDVLRRLGMRMVLQNVDTQDWRRKRRAIVARALRGAQPGAIILMHDGGGNRAQTAAALPAIIRRLQRQGYRVVSVPTLLREDPPALDWPVPYSACPGAVLPAVPQPPATLRERASLGTPRAG